MSNEEALEELKKIRFNLNYKVNGTSRFDEALNMAIKALESESGMNWVQEAVNAIMNTCDTDSVIDKAMRNAAKFVQNAIDGSYPDFEKLEQDWISVTERLPEVNEEAYSNNVLVSLKATTWDIDKCQMVHITNIAFYDENAISSDSRYMDTEGWVLQVGNTLSMDEVIAWMPLPEPYKEDE